MEVRERDTLWGVVDPESVAAGEKGMRSCITPDTG